MRDKQNHKKQKLLQVSAQLFNEKGYQATTMQDIADSLGIKKGSIYYYIKTKEDLLYELGVTTLQMLLDSAYKVHKLSVEPDEKLRRFIYNHMQLLCKHLDLFTVSLRELNKINVPTYWNEIVKLRKEYEDIARNIVQEGQAAGLYRNYDYRIVVNGILGMMNWIIRWYSPHGYQSPDDISEVWTEMILYGLYVKSTGKDE
jgi:AcrR family transcriptional regulator